MGQPSEDQLRALNQAGAARVVFNHLAPIFEALEVAALADLKNSYRSGDFDQVKMLVKVGQLCSLEDIKTRLTMQINRGNTAGKELAEDESPSRR